MRLDTELAEFATDRDTELTIGVFDGVHRGHRHLIDQVVKEAAETDRLSGVITLRNHPSSVLDPNFTPNYLTTVDERLRLLGELGVDLVIPITFDRELSLLSARDFVGRLRKHLRMAGLLVGSDFTLGHKREGDLKMLHRLGGEMGFSLQVASVLTDGDRTVKSTTIRQAVAQGDVSRASKMLGRTFSLPGVVVKGVGRGKTLGFPTANLEPPAGTAIPMDGIYATWASIDGVAYMAATSIGRRPTFDEDNRTVEAFILDFDGDLYGREVRLEFVRRLRDELKFEAVEDLQAQVDIDVDDTRTILGALHMGCSEAKTHG
jgi:riboflavin kinase/FMN adenylyltransferase